MTEDLPFHLRDDAPYQVCSKCGRKTWAPGDFGKVCNMTQPNGYRCAGLFDKPPKA